MNVAFSETIGMIYDCVAQEELWPRALAALTRHVDGFLTALAVFDTETHTTRLAQLACEDETAVAALMRYAGKIPFYHLLHRMEIDEPVLLDHMFSLYGPDGADVWREGDLYRHWHAPYQIHDSINMAVLKRPNRIATLNISMQTPEIGGEQIDLVGLVGPHIRRAITIHDMLGMERNESQIFRDVLDRLEHGVIVVSDTMEVLYANATGERLMREQLLLAMSDAKLIAKYPMAQRALARAVQIGTTDEVNLAGIGIDIPLGVTEQPAVAHVLPLARRTVQRRIETRAAAAIFVAASRSMSQTPIEAIAALFALTSAERRVAGYVSDGMTRFEIAQAQGVSEGTVKTQLSAIYDKTGTGDQRSLQTLLKDLTPPVRQV